MIKIMGCLSGCVDRYREMYIQIQTVMTLKSSRIPLIWIGYMCKSRPMK